MTETEIRVLMCLTVMLVILVPALISFCVKLGPFAEEMRYINMELGRCSARMRRVWRQRKRRLWCSLLIPFYKYEEY